MDDKKIKNKANKSVDLRKKTGLHKISTQEALAQIKPPKRRKSAKSSEKLETVQSENNNILANDNHISELDIIDGEIKDSLLDLKGKMTNRELKFLELYVTGSYRIIKAMKMAGYVKGSNTYLYLLAKKIVEKYERSAADHRNIFRMVGLGEIAVARGILRCCQTAKTNKDQREAWALAAKCLGLQREVIEGGASGVTIIIGTGADQPGEAMPVQDRPTYKGDQQIQPAPAPLMITK